MSYFGTKYGHFALPLSFNEIETERFFQEGSYKKNVSIFLETSGGMAHIGDLTFWRSNLTEKVPKNLSFSFFSNYKKELLTNNLWEEFLKIIRNFIDRGGALEFLYIRDMNPYIFPNNPEKRFVLASSLKKRAKGLPYSLSDLDKELGLEIVIHPLQDVFKGTKLSVFDLTSLGDVFYFISLDNVFDEACIFYDNYSKAHGCKFILEERISAQKSLTLTFVAGTAWTDGIFLSEERYSPVFSSFNQTASSLEDANVVPIILNLQHCFLTQETLLSLKLCLEGRKLYHLKVSEEDQAVLETFVRQNQKSPLSAQISYDDGKVLAWESLTKNTRIRHFEEDIEALTVKRNSEKTTKKSLSLEDIFKQEKRK